ncbi:MAG: hypothetical protein K0S32_3875 [Bacteroidetes bacterium]|jgi:hypothetical protein|nr:hypothetical protein [Bacteroidota bacterium]
MFTLCKPISNKKRFSPNRKLDDNFSFTLFPNAGSVNASEWDLITGKKTVFLEREFLSVIETCSNTKLISRYVIVYNDNKPCGVIYFQIIDFQAGIFGDLLSNQVETIRSKRLKLFENYIGANKEEVLMRLFTCGNNVVSGDYGFRFTKSISKEIAHRILLEITEIVSKEEKLRGTISAILLKDFEKKLEPKSLFVEEKYTDFFVEPNMVLDLPANVNSVNDYIQLFSKKYRNRAKSIFKSAGSLTKRNLEAEEIKRYENEIYKLYESVYDKAKFKLLKLPQNYFHEIKSWLPEKFFVTGTFLDDKLIAFNSCFLMEHEHLEAHYIGFDYEINHAYDLYQNILYQIIELAIANKRTKVNLGRTAAEIKTTVGAKAVDLICYVKPQNTISKLIMKPFISFLQPAEWTPRNPFKEESLQDSSEQQKQSTG